jgi:transcriptional regulator with XRE-family HTH domain
MQRVKLGMSQTELGDALGVTFQQIQKYELGKNAVASTRIADLCRALEMTPNDLFGVSSKVLHRLPTGIDTDSVSIFRHLRAWRSLAEALYWDRRR